LLILANQARIGENDEVSWKLACMELADLFIATIKELGDLDDMVSPTSLMPGMADSEIDLLMLCNLESILTGNEWESVFDRDYGCPLREDGPDGPWIYQVSKNLLDSLQCLSPEAILECARVWSDYDEWTLRADACIESIAELISSLAALAKQALTEGKQVYIWTRP
jgi:hypothetical protein